MLNTLVLEIRDRGTLIPCIATQLRTKPLLHEPTPISAAERLNLSAAGLEMRILDNIRESYNTSPELGTQEAYLLKRAGYEDGTIFVTILDGSDKHGNVVRTYRSTHIHDIAVNEQGRTIPVALRWIMDPTVFRGLLTDQKQQVPTSDHYNILNRMDVGVVDVEYILQETNVHKDSSLFDYLKTKNKQPDIITGNQVKEFVQRKYEVEGDDPQ